MPFKSKKQERWAFANKKPWAKKWAAMTDQISLPIAASKGRKKKKRKKK